ncbi:ATP synthase subunit delta, sodium ion specific [Peptoclostridium acidaminophilum DSM 3953]|uniref:ATP synthase subunit delta n=1 Tax=Peptoclostridium acidaminophilum DSM 3953 TaxID=1286171 RepID=W8THQ2_PEPAC|nr:F0F1 ATP synthase subunit delta [Peptoclostridium acidaminophilum]AHM55692.1 ATP synthase subunit delta, sodium ion specific [Peptoclostridium acidaminophilum DSM 3953]
MAELVARRYAGALFEVGLEENKLDSFEQELEVIAAAFSENKEFSDIFKAPMVPKEEKKSLIENIFKGKASDETVNFIKILIDKDRISVLDEISTEFAKLVNEHNNIEEAVAVSAVPIAEDKLEALKVQLAKVTGKSIKIKNEINPSVMGGILVRIGNEEIDGTVKGRLDRLKDELHQIIA